MDEEQGHWHEASAAPAAEPGGAADTAAHIIDESTSQPFVGQWNQLVSNTNWEKGRIICQWRDAMDSAGAPPAEYSDEAWSRRVGGVTGQHVGRLRRVFRRFGETQTQFGGLYWSHFFAALEWEDAEMWLEGAIRNSWSVSQLRRMRWETLGAVADQKPLAEDDVTGELDEDFEPALRATPGTDTGDRAEDDRADDERAEKEQTHRARVADDEDLSVAAADDEEAANGDESWETANAKESKPKSRLRPFADLPELPDDLADAFESFKLAILAHRADGWQDVEADDVIRSLDALKQLALSTLESE
jgi:hypothetical protein